MASGLSTSHFPMTYDPISENEKQQLAWLDNLQTAVVLLSPELEIYCANNAAQTLLGRSARQLVGQSLDRLAKNAPQLRDKAQRVIKENHSLTERDFELMRLDNDTILVDAKFSPYAGEPAIGVILELNETSRLRENLTSEGMNAHGPAYDIFLKGLRHEIKNPLGGMRGAAQLLGRQLSPDLLEYVDVIISEVDRLNRLVDNLDHAPRDEKKELANVYRLLEHVIALVSSEAEGRLALERDYDPSVPDLMVYPELLIQAFLNLATNAVNAGASKLKIRTRVEFGATMGDSAGTSLRIDFADDGCGVPSELGDRIFLPMVTSRNEGSGIGLAIVSTTALAHNGAVTFTSSPGATVFSLLIPMESDNDC